MKDTVPTVGRSPQVPAAQGTGTKLRFCVSFYRRMRLHGVYPAVVTARSLDRGAPAHGPVELKAVVPGAVVTPSELSLDVGDPRASATFYVTPLAKGALPGARIEVFHHGNLVQAIRLPMKGTTQCLTWTLAFLTVAVPAFLLYSTVYHRMQGNLPLVVRQRPVLEAGPNAEEPAAPKERKKQEGGPPLINPGPGQPPTTRQGDALWLGFVGLIPAFPGQQDKEKKEGGNPDTETKPAAKAQAPGPAQPPEPAPIPRKKDGSDEKKAPEAGQQEKPAPGPGSRQEGEGPRNPGAPPGRMPGRGGNQNPKDEPQPIDKAKVAAQREAARKIQNNLWVAGSPGELLAQEIREHVPEVPMSWQDRLPWMPKITANFAWGIGQVYDFACTLSTEYLSYYVGVVLLLLTLVSWLTHRSVRGRRGGAPVVLGP